MDHKQKKSKFAKVFGIYIGILLLLTFLSKSIYMYRLPVVSVSLPKQGKITTSKDSPQYDALIPAEALRKDSVGYYVLVLHEDDSVLGDGYVAHRMSVDLLDSDETYCAVRGLPTDEIVIVSATSEITDGSKVCYGD